MQCENENVCPIIIQEYENVHHVRHSNYNSTSFCFGAVRTSINKL